MTLHVATWFAYVWFACAALTALIYTLRAGAGGYQPSRQSVTACLIGAAANLAWAIWLGVNLFHG